MKKNVNTTDDFAKKATEFSQDKVTEATKWVVFQSITTPVSSYYQTRKLKIHKENIKLIQEGRRFENQFEKRTPLIQKRENLLTKRKQLLNKSNRLDTALGYLDVDLKEEKFLKKDTKTMGRDPTKKSFESDSIAKFEKKKNQNQRSRLDNPLTSKTVGSRNFAQKVVTSPVKALSKTGTTLKDGINSEVEESDMAGIQLANQMISPVASTLKFEANHFVARKVGFDRKAYRLEKIEKKILKVDKKLAKETKAKRKRIRKEAKINAKLIPGNTVALASPINMRIFNAMNFSTGNIFKNIVALVQSIKNIKGLAIIGGFALIFLIPMLLMTPIATLGGGALIGINSNTTASQLSLSRAMLDEDVLKWEQTVLKELKAYGLEDYLDMVLVIIQLESGGRVKDVMQSSESAGLAPNAIKNEQDSIKQGVKYLNDLIKAQKSYGVDIQTLIHAYNYGIGFISYVASNGGKWTQKLADNFSSIQAEKMGWKSYGDPSYVSKAMKYLTVNENAVSLASAVNPLDFYADMKTEMEKYSGMVYVWGGKNPQTGFDCSGLTAYLYSLFGIQIDSYTVSQFDQSTPVSLENARAGDLIFFRGTYGSADFISHVGIYVNETTMFDANSSGVGYHTWNTGYWSQHRPSIRRVITK